ncbi:hypothetical protein [Uliginosibacterium gangwonense]|uniref:hypothetical protein n=1 Tax=Uliginosibacterium gangwonense TaxID=392736 RepID=UPI0003A13A09|nr:hypothetical protein [Uliginosibacterium gangwonense]
MDEHTTNFHSGVLVPASIRICEGEEEFWRDSHEEGWEVCDVLPRTLVERWFDEGDDF